MMKEKNNIEFDLMMRSILADAEEQVPEHVWESVSSRLTAKRRTAALWKWSGAVAAAAAAVAIALTLPGTSREGMPEAAVQDLTAQMVAPVTGSAPQIVEEAEEETVVKAENTKPVTIIKKKVAPADEILVADLAEKQVEAKDTPEAVLKEEKKEEQKEQTSRKQEKWTDPFAVMDYEDAHKKAPVKVALDFNGLVGTNDSAKPGHRGNAIRCTVANGTASHNTASLVEDGESTYGVPVSVGLGARVSFGNRWSAGAGISYTLLTRSFSGIYNFDGKGVKVDNVTHDIQYIGIPVNVYYNMLSNDIVSLYTFAGGSIERAVSNKYMIPYSGKNEVLKQDIEGLQLSAGIGLGVQFKVTDNIGIYLDPSARYYFGSNQPKSIRTQQPIMFSLEAGLRFNL